jgi:hypothetical protein
VPVPWYVPETLALGEGIRDIGRFVLGAQGVQNEHQLPLILSQLAFLVRFAMPIWAKVAPVAKTTSEF